MMNDKKGDLANKLIYVKSIKGDEITIILPDKTEAITSEENLDINQKTIRKYDPKKDPHFI